MAKVAWKNLDQQILDAIAGLEEHGFKEPTIRSVYYVLGSMNVIPLTRSGYKSLDAKIVEMRKRGKIRWGFFAVKRGTSDEAGIPVPLPGGYQATLPFPIEADEWADQWADFWVEQVRKAHETFTIPRWYGQDNLVEVWVEKDGLLGATANWLEDLEVTVRAPQGYGAWEFIYASLGKIRRELKVQKKKHVHILYLGDLDPSGKDIPRFMSEDAIEHLRRGMDLTFRELGLSPEQVREHNLPEQPDSAEVMEKIERDPRMAWYQENYPADMFVELDAFYALATDAARELIRNAVIDLFDDEVFQETRLQEDELRARIETRVREELHDGE